jgi:hypothetical protein
MKMSIITYNDKMNTANGCELIHKEIVGYRIRFDLVLPLEPLGDLTIKCDGGTLKFASTERVGIHTLNLNQKKGYVMKIY